MKPVLVVDGTEVGTVGFEISLGPEHKLVRGLDGQIHIVWERHLMERTSDVDEALRGLTPRQVEEICRELAKEKKP